MTRRCSPPSWRGPAATCSSRSRAATSSRPCGGWRPASRSSTRRSPDRSWSACAGENVEDERLARLTAQERNILELIADGKTNRQIADELYLAEKTVKNYVSNLLSKMGFARRTEAAVYAAVLAERKHKTCGLAPVSPT